MSGKQINDLVALKKQMDQQGYCILRDLIPADTISQIHRRIENQACAEKQLELTTQDQVQSDDDRNQWVYLLINKGEIFQTLFENETAHEIVRHVLGPDFLLSDFSATITHPGNGQMGLHRDQWWLPEPRMPLETHQRCGDIDRSNVSKGQPKISPTPINPPVICNVLWMISDFSIENGGTRIVPRSHLSGINPEPHGDYDTINATGSAGSAVIFEGRTWHAADFNTSNASRYGITTYYGAPQFRQMLNFTYGMKNEVAENLSPKSRSLLGFKPWRGYGATGDQHAETIVPGDQQIGELGD
ncbi:MAG: ectoine hydroxylase-related dioxygenase (phytanoyl-CoA dioxygenase family) [Planctomycetota bacterium]|jgi:ectoine hydroxylase-related dioxygenase (phytanoyl-CoA dioxygenase family)